MENYNARYARHYSIKDFGIEGQLKLTAAKVLVIGAGGLGCPALQYLVAAGVGTVGIADHDHVSLSNLQRQVLYGMTDIGKFKTEAAYAMLKNLNPEISIQTYNTEITVDNAFEMISKYDIVLDCTDNFASRYLINDACVLLEKPLVFGAIYQFEGQIAVFNVADSEGKKTNYRHLFPAPPDPDEVANCNEIGVLGVLPGVIGVMQAAEVIKLLTGIGEGLVSKLLTFNLLNYEIFVIEITNDESVSELMPKDEATFKATDYNWLCGLSINGVQQIDTAAFLDEVNRLGTVIIDIREVHELPKADFPVLQIPLSDLRKSIPEFNEDNLVLFCQSGKRSLKAAEMFLEKFGTTKKISHLKGGMIALEERINEQVN